MTTFFILTFGFVVTFIMWLIVVFLHIDNPKYKYIENPTKTLFYWVAVIFSVIIGILIK